MHKHVLFNSFTSSEKQTQENKLMSNNVKRVIIHNSESASFHFFGHPPKIQLFLIALNGLKCWSKIEGQNKYKITIEEVDQDGFMSLNLQHL